MSDMSLENNDLFNKRRGLRRDDIKDMDEFIMELKAREFLTRQAEAKLWIEEMIKEKLPDGTANFVENLRDGHILCKLAKVFAPGVVGIVHKIKFGSVMEMLASDNMSKFFKALDHIKFDKTAQFSFPDIWEKKNIKNVVECIHKLARHLEKQGKFVNIKDLSNAGLEFDEEEIIETKEVLKKLEEEEVKKPVRPKQVEQLKPIEDEDEEEIPVKLKKRDPTITTSETSEHHELISIKPDSNDMRLDAVQDFYQGKKLRRRISLIRWYMGDYLRFSNHKIMQKLTQKYGASKILYSGIVAKVNKRYAVQNRIMIITDEAIYNVDPNSYQINRRIPLTSLGGISVSQMRDGFFVLHVPEEYDYLHVSSNKTEIIKCIRDQYKKLTGKTLPLHVSNKLVYYPYYKSKGKTEKTIEFVEDSKIKMPTILLTKTGIMVKVNNTEDATMEANHKDIGIEDKLDSIYGGRKYRRKTSIGRQYLGDYLRLAQSPVVKQILKMNGDKILLFSDNVLKINKKYKTQNRILLITDKALYNVDPNQFKVKRRIKLEDIAGVSVSSMTDGHFAIHVPGSYDYLFSSDKKTEIIDTLHNAMAKMFKNLKVNVSDRFEYCPNGQDIESVSFVLDDNATETLLENTSNGLIVHVSHEEPSVVFEAAFVHIKDQPKPIEVSSQPILIKLRKKWKYKLEIRFYVNEPIEGCSFHEKIDTVSSRQEYISKVGTLTPRDERYVITLPERTVLFSVLSKTRVKAKLVDPNQKVLLAVRFVYDVR